MSWWQEFWDALLEVWEPGVLGIVVGVLLMVAAGVELLMLVAVVLP